MIKIELETLGKKIRNIRIEKGLSLKQLAEEMKVSSSLLSQIERGLANPSLTTLRSISQKLEVPMFSLFEDEKNKDTKIVRKKERIQIKNGKSNSDKLELGYDLLTPNLKGAIQMCEMHLGPHQISSEKLNKHNAEEVAVCTKGSIELNLKDEVFLLNKGDSVVIEKNTPHFWENPTNKSCTIIFAMTPPIF